MVEPVRLSERASALELLEPLLLSTKTALDVLKGYLFGSPTVGKNRVRRNIVLLKSSSFIPEVWRRYIVVTTRSKCACCSKREEGEDAVRGC